jgi:hypothetical protein
MENQYVSVMTGPKRIPLYAILSALTAFLVLIASVGSFVFKDIYTPFAPAGLIPFAYGQDLVSLLVVPVLILSLLLWRNSPHGVILQAGTLLYIAYAYALYAFGAIYNGFFLVYIALVGLPIYALIGIITHIDGEAYRRRLKADFPHKVVSLYLIIIAVLVTTAWVSVLLPTIIKHTSPGGINTVYVLDLALLLPACVVGAVQLWQCQTWGYLLSGILLVKVVTLGLSIVLGQLFAFLRHGTFGVWQTGLFGGLALVGVVVLSAYLRNIQ